jgi:hypothetical protein
VAYVRTEKTASGATAVQIVYYSRRGSRSIEHLGSAHDDQEMEALKAAARQRLASGQDGLDLGLPAGTSVGGPLEIASSRMGHLHDALRRAYDVLGLGEATGGDEVFWQLVLAQIIEPTSKQDSLRTLQEAGVGAVSYPTLNCRRRPTPMTPGAAAVRRLRRTRHAGTGIAGALRRVQPSFENDQGDGFREPGFSKERRLEPQITIVLLTDRPGRARANGGGI